MKLPLPGLLWSSYLGPGTASAFAPAEAEERYSLLQRSPGPFVRKLNPREHPDRCFFLASPTHSYLERIKAAVLSLVLANKEPVCTTADCRWRHTFECFSSQKSFLHIQYSQLRDKMRLVPSSLRSRVCRIWKTTHPYQPPLAICENL